jgi:hypothetical protein
VRLQPSVKLKIDMLNTSIGSCLGALGRKTLRNLLLKLFSRCLGFIVIFSLVSNGDRAAAWSHKAVVGFFSTSFEGGRKCGRQRGRLLELQVDSSQTRPKRQFV